MNEWMNDYGIRYAFEQIQNKKTEQIALDELCFIQR